MHRPAEQVRDGPRAGPARGGTGYGTALLLVAITGLALILRLPGLTAKSLWIDEAFSLWMATQDLDAIWRYTTLLDKHPPLYYVLLHLWLPPDAGEFALRSLSVLFAVATVPVVYVIGRDAGGTRLGLLAAGLVAVSPLHVWYAQQGRMYAMLTFFAAVATACLVRLLVAGPTLRPAAAAACWAGLAGGTAAAMLTHNTAVLLPVAVAGYLGYRAVRDARRRIDPDATVVVRRGYGAAPVAAGLGVAVLLWLPWLPWFLRQARAVDAEFWLPAPTPAAVVEHLANLGSARAPAEVAPLLVAAGFAVLAAIGAARLRGGAGLGVLLLALVLVPVAAELLVSLRRPIFYTQTLVWTAVPFVVLVTAGLLRLRRGALVAAATAAVLAVNTASLVTYHAEPGQEDWRGAAAHVAALARPGDVILFHAAWTRLAFGFYYRSAGAPLVEHGVPTDLFERGELEPLVTPADLPRVDALVAGRPRVWVVYSHDWYTDPDGLVEQRLAATRVEVHRVEFRAVRVVGYAGR